MWSRLVSTSNDRTVAVLRIALGFVMLPHALQKTLGLFGGAGVGGTLQFFNQMLGIPTVLGLLVILAETFGSLGLLLGFLGRAAAASIAAIMLGAIYLVHWNVGFFMNWTGTQAGEGFEYHILALAIALAVMVKGSGAWSIDLRLAPARETTEEPKAQQVAATQKAA
ncbi:MAG: hypothetical protein KatS3mg081_1358 [Gemmatimonadales bacterium]|nr:MAG: hypothetical protein KatS3mg081_1358 [Gemmatimonadales bacterium]